MIYVLYVLINILKLYSSFFNLFYSKSCTLLIHALPIVKKKSKYKRAVGTTVRPTFTNVCLYKHLKVVEIELPKLCAKLKVPSRPP